MKLQPNEVVSRLATAPGWEHDGESIRKRYRFAAFADSIAFVTRLAFDAEAADHHPDLQVSYRNVTVTWSTHSAGGVTVKDFDGAAQSDRIAAQLGA
jgi:4a-hydroxytetrahydrobiopterin dehydratase